MSDNNNNNNEAAADNFARVVDAAALAGPMDLDTLVRSVISPLLQILNCNDIDTRERLEELEAAHGRLVEHIFWATPPALRVLLHRTADNAA